MLGIAVGAAILKAAPSIVPPGLLPLSVPLAFDQRVLMFSVATTFVVAILYGLVPAWQATGTSLVHIMSLDTRTSTGGSSTLRKGLAIAEVAVAVLLLCGAGLLLRTLLTLEDVDPGNRAGELLTTAVSPGVGRRSEMRCGSSTRPSSARCVPYPACGDVAWGSALPLDGQFFGQAFEIDGDPPRPPAESRRRDLSDRRARRTSACSAYPCSRDAPSPTPMPPRLRKSASWTRRSFGRYLKGRAPIGTRLLVNAMVQPPQAVLREIVGVVKHVKQRPDEPEAQPQIYVPIAQNTWWLGFAGGAAGEWVGRARSHRRCAPRSRASNPIGRCVFRTLTTIQTQATSRPRFRAVLVGAFALLALTLALVGVFGVLAYSVQQRTREFGVRIALGASAASVLRLVISSAGVSLAVGVAIGLAVAALVEPIDFDVPLWRAAARSDDVRRWCRSCSARPRHSPSPRRPGARRAWIRWWRFERVVS